MASEEKDRCQSEILDYTPTFLEYKKTVSEIIVPGNSAIIDLASSSLQDLSVLKTSKVKKINHLILSNNKLTEIDQITSFPDLTRLIAENNMISKIELHLPKLIELNLSKNKISDVKYLN